MRLDQLQYLVEVSDCGSITIAAERLHVSQPNVSQSIASLEEELKTTIFIRSRSGAKPTEAGKAIIDRAREILNQVAELKKAARTQDSELTGTISIATIPSMCMTLLPKTLAVFKSKFPKVQIEIIEAGSIKAKDSVLNGEVELGLVSRRQPSDFDDAKLQFEPLLIGETMACVSKYFALSSKKNISLEEIIKHPIVIFNQEYRMNSYILTRLKQYGEPNILFTASNPESLKKVIAEGLAIGFYADFALKTDPYVNNGDIIPLPIAEQQMNTLFGVLRKKNKHLTPASEEFISELRAQAVHFKRIYNLADLNII
ncbi:LysR family transcriptional regulator [Paenibacillus hamazuiensis]|uniref:LysR family transcriptional regulator n=1 Tax=Paenibacillus hamazuiensis TaxID=2936508 RepID=UPI00200C4231|nr:LysR family transcriptional regulator [Paenibacillus hamazuiensis]